MFHRLWTLIRKELQSLLREPQTRAILILPVLIQVILFPFAATLEVTNATIAIYNEDNGKHSVELTQRFARASAFTHVLLLKSPQEIQPTIDTQKALLLVRFPANFSRNLDTFQQAPMQIILDGRNSNSAQIAANYLQQIVKEYQQELMDGKRKNGYAYGRGEKYSLELGGDINRAIASEFAMLAAPETLPLFLRKLQRKALKQYQRREPICKGSGDIICMLDESSSAESQAPWCKAVALALLDIAMRDQRRFAVIHFAGVGDVQTDLFLPGQYDREDVLRCAETSLNGNTDYETPLREALRLMEQEGFENADMVFVTDGECVLPDSFLEQLTMEQSVKGFQITGILLDQEDAGFEFSLREFCTNIYRTSQLSRDQIAEQLVVSRVA